MGLASTSTHSSCRLDRLQSIILDDPAWSCIAALVSGPLLNHFAQQQQHMARYFQLQDLVSANQFFPFTRVAPTIASVQGRAGHVCEERFCVFPPSTQPNTHAFCGKMCLDIFQNTMS